MASGSRVGTMIKRRRQELDWTQEELARRVGVDVSSVTGWESGKHFPSRHQGKLELVLGISLGEEEYTDPVEAAIWGDESVPVGRRHELITDLRRAREEQARRTRRPPA